MTRQIFHLLTKTNIRMKAEHIPGINNTLADRLSRLDRAGDYELLPEVYLRGITELGVLPTVDCFANKMNHKCQRFFAPVRDQLAGNAVAFDAMQQPWKRETLPYLHPPIELIPQVLQKIRSEKCSAVLVVPFWPAHSWWSSITSLLIKQTILGKTEDILRRGPTMDPRLNNLPPGKLVMCLVSSPQ
jgi:hypothetical protein